MSADLETLAPDAGRAEGAPDDADVEAAAAALDDEVDADEVDAPAPDEDVAPPVIATEDDVEDDVETAGGDAQTEETGGTEAVAPDATPEAAATSSATIEDAPVTGTATAVDEGDDAGSEAAAASVGAAQPPDDSTTTDAPRPRRRWPWYVAAAVFLTLVMTAAAFASATVSYADAHEGLFLPGTQINGVAVGGLTQAEAVREVSKTLRDDLGKTVTVRFGDQEWQAQARTLGVRSNVRRVVADVAASQSEVSWREWAGLRWFGEQSSSTGEVELSYRRRPVAAFVKGIAAAVARKPADAELVVNASSISVTPHQAGLKVRTRAVTRDLYAALRGENQPVRLAVKRIAPEVKSSAYDQVLLLDQSDHVLRLFLDGEEARSWIVAVGTGDYPTPTGQYEVSLKRYMPTWVNPDPDGWGKDMPESIPPGENNPLGVRALNWSAPGAIRFHGTQAIDSLGTDASHGCVRMSNDDVSELYDLVDEGAVIISQI